MDAVTLGPLVLPLRLLAPISALLASHLVVWFCKRKGGFDASPYLWHMTLWGFAAARTAFVLQHWDSFRDAPFGMLDIRDDGFVTFAGMLVVTAVSFEFVRRTPALRRPLTAAAFAGVLAWAVTNATIHSIQPMNVGLPALVLYGVDGKAVNLGQLRGRQVVVNLWATWCPPCRREMPALTAAQAAHPEATFLFVNAGEDIATVNAYLRGAGVTPRNVLVDASGTMAQALNVSGYPTTIFYDRRGLLAARHMGELSRAGADEQLSKLETK